MNTSRVSIVVLIALGALLAGATTANKQSTETNITVHPPYTQIDRAIALRIAQSFAYDLGMIPTRYSPLVKQNDEGEWYVWFYSEPYPNEDDMTADFNHHHAPTVRISRQGCCRIYNNGTRDMKKKAEGYVNPELLTCESAAVLIARSLLIREGLLPTETRTEEIPTADGGWLIAFTPGRYHRPYVGAGNRRSYRAHLVIHVNSVGTCEMVPEWAFLTDGIPTEQCPLPAARTLPLIGIDF